MYHILTDAFKSSPFAAHLAPKPRRVRAAERRPECPVDQHGAAGVPPVLAVPDVAQDVVDVAPQLVIPQGSLVVAENPDVVDLLQLGGGETTS